MMEELDPSFHTHPILDDDGNVVGEEYVLDEDGKPIPKTICLCNAYEPNECCCGAWDDVTDWDYD